VRALPASPPAPPSLPGATSFDALYRDTADDLFAYVATLVGDRGAAEEVVAAAFERAFRRFATYDARRGGARQWLFGIARNAALDELRRRRRSAALAADPADVAVAPEDDADPARRAAVRAALAGLSPRERELVALKFVAGLDNAGIGALLGISASNAGTRLHRALHRLREACHAPS
jgi:RNA polymerase sigma-70 factor (ECF subfamily)